MKKIIIVSDSLRVGGIQRSLENLLNEIDYDKFDVTLKLFHFKKEYETRINRNVKIVHGSKILNFLNLSSREARNKGMVVFMFRKFLALLCRVFNSNLVYSLIFLFEKKLSGFDIAISYSNNINNKSVYFGVNKYVLEKINANKKITWLHVDFNEMKLNNPYNAKEYSKFDKIVHVSYAVKKSFTDIFPEMTDKSTVVYNFIPILKIRKLSQSFYVEKKIDKTIISVGRFDENKSQKSFVDVAIYLKKMNINFQWWMIGDGPEINEVKKLLKANEIDDQFIMMGEIDNPYPYIKKADLFISASKSESFGLAIAESLVLNTPVVARDYPALEEIITGGVNGIISHGDNSMLSKTVYQILKDNEALLKLKNNTKLLINKELVLEQFENAMNSN